MEELLLGLLEEARTDKKKLAKLKDIAVSYRQFVLADQIRNMEEELFPDSPEQEEAKKLNLVFRMVDLNIHEEVAWLIDQTLRVYRKKKGKFNVMDAAKLVNMRNQIFGEG